MESEDLISQAVDLLEAGNLDKGEEILLQILSKAPDDGTAWTNLAKLYLLRGQADDARGAAERGVSLSPLDPIAWHNLGECYNYSGAFNEALSCHNRALALGSNHARIWSARGSALMGLGRYTTAILCFDRALADEPAYRPAVLSRKVASLIGDEHGARHLSFVLGLATTLAEKGIERELATKRLERLAGSKLLRPEIVDQLDAVAELNLNNQVFPLCEFTWLNSVLARLLSSENMIELTQHRFEEAYQSRKAAGV